MDEELNESAAENEASREVSPNPAWPPGRRQAGDLAKMGGCTRAFLWMLFGVWLLFVVGGVWINAGWKSKYQVDVTAGRWLPTDGGRPRDLLLVIGLPSVVATIVAVLLNRGDGRSFRAIGWAYVFAAISAASGAIVWVWPTHISCRTVTGVTDIFPNYGPATCPSDYLNAANDAIRAINWASVGLVFIGVVGAIITGWTDRTARREARSEVD